MKALVIGYGSIGRRHARLLAELRCQVAVMSHRSIQFSPCYSDLSVALDHWQPDYVVVANLTSEHRKTIEALVQCSFKGRLLVEKPLFDQPSELLPQAFSQTAVAYNLRFHPIIQRLKSLMISEQIISFLVYAGQYLPEWRPERDYRESYSAAKEDGGGVLRDLSHELDYLIWLLEGWVRVSALGGHFSPLEITSDDVFALSMVTSRCPVVTVQLNYLDRMSRRFIVVNTAEHTIEADLIRATLTIDRTVETFDVEKDMTYKVMHKSIMDGGCETLCSLDEGIEVLRLIEAAELSIEQKKWINR